MRHVKLKYKFSYTLRGRIMRHKHTKDLLSILTSDVYFARQNHVIRNWTRPGTGKRTVLPSNVLFFHLNAEYR